MDKISHIVPVSARMAPIERIVPEVGPEAFEPPAGAAAEDDGDGRIFILAVGNAPPANTFTPRGSFVDVRA